MELSAKALEGRLRDGKAISQPPFTTADGVKGYKLAVEGEQKEKRLRFSHYFLDGPGNRRILATGTTLAEDGERLDAVFDGTMATFQWEAAAPEKKAGVAAP
jgi:hypothetical protein